jgi:flagellar biosynthesis protein
MMEFQHKLKLAVALKYTQSEDVSPLVVASGRGSLAQALVRKALDLDIPIHPDGELAELLSEVDVGHSIPEELYEVVAQIMAMVYRMDMALSEKGMNGKALGGKARERK